jgi:8-oxo-dGTP pyrophosphatase MutT (NUDIX family)
MNKTEFLHHFRLKKLKKPAHRYQYHSALKSAAVLILLIDDGKGLQVLLTKRAEHLKHHGGQISFPGGKVEPSDANIIATALRETKEEIGMDIAEKNIIGQLHTYQTISGFVVTPMIAIVSEYKDYIIDQNEVAEVFLVPLQHFLNQKNHQSIMLEHKGKPHPVMFMPYKHYNIWGATAAMLKDLALHLSE